MQRIEHYLPELGVELVKRHSEKLPPDRIKNRPIGASSQWDDSSHQRRRIHKSNHRKRCGPPQLPHIPVQSNIRKITPIGRRRRRLPRSFLAEGPRASRALSASRASSSPNSTGSSPAWPSPCRGRPSGRRGRTRRATMRACGLRPARRWASSACSCAGATWPLCWDAWWPGRCSRRAPCAPSSTGSPGPPCPCALGSL